MRKMLFLSIPAYIFFSCSKDEAINYTTPYIKFDGNGTEYFWEGQYNDSQRVKTAGVAILHNNNWDFRDNEGYSLYAYDNRGIKGHWISFAITIDSILTTGTYNYPAENHYYRSLFRLLFWDNSGTQVVSGADYLNLGGADYVSITITNMRNGYVDGEFRAQLQKFNTGDTIFITQGVFKNLKIIE